MDLISRVKTLIEEELEQTPFFIVDVLGGEKQRKVTVLLDGDDGITIQKCSEISRSVSKVIDEDSFESDPFILEVSSPGADRPLTNPRQYKKHLGRTLEVELLNGTTVMGKLTEVADGVIELAPKEKKNKKKQVESEMTEQTQFSMDEIAEARVVISFK